MNKVQERFASRLTNAVERDGRHKNAIAAKAGISGRHLERLMKGESWPEITTLNALSQTLNVAPEWFFADESPENLRTVAEPTAPYETTPTPSAKEIADLILAYGNAESSLRASIRRQLGLEKSDREAFERHVLSYREQRDKTQIKDRKGE